MKSCSRDIQLSCPLVIMLRLSCSVVNIDGLRPSASHSLGSLDFSLDCSWILSLALLSTTRFPKDALMRSCYTLILSYSHPLILSYSYTLILSYPHTLILSYSHILILLYSHTLIPSYSATLIHSYSHTLILSYSHILVLSYSLTLLPSYSHTLPRRRAREARE